MKYKLTTGYLRSREHAVEISTSMSEMPPCQEKYVNYLQDIEDLESMLLKFQQACQKCLLAKLKNVMIFYAM